ncbi:MAG: hypothetical protein ACHQ4H_13340 [Ktedonobacterales bacterium]
MSTQTATDAEREVIQFLTGRPSPEEITAFHPSSEVSARVYALLGAERENRLSAEDERELSTYLYLYLEHFMRMMKAEAHRRLVDRAS